MDLTYGLEIELVDILRNDNLPHNCRWASQEITLVNSNGQAVWSHDPNKPLGGEINTPPTRSIQEQVQIITDCLNLYPEANINYRCNTQCHVGFVQRPTLEQMKQMMLYFYNNFEDLHKASLSGAITKPAGMPSYTWHHYRHSNIPSYQIPYIIEAQTEKDLRAAFFLGKNGKQAFMTFRRHMLNFHCLFNHGTIEFRGFWSTKDISLIESCLRFSDSFVRVALTDPELPAREWAYDFTLPKELLFDPVLEAGFQATKASKDSLPKEDKRYEIYSIYAR